MPRSGPPVLPPPRGWLGKSGGSLFALIATVIVAGCAVGTTPKHELVIGFRAGQAEPGDAANPPEPAEATAKVVADVAKVAAPFIPPPFGQIAAGIGLAAAGFADEHRTRRASYKSYAKGQAAGERMAARPSSGGAPT